MIYLFLLFRNNRIILWLRKINNLKLKTASGRFNIAATDEISDSLQNTSTFETSFNEQDNNNVILSKINDISNECYEAVISAEEVILMTYVSGYIIYKLNITNICAGCKKLISTDRELIDPGDVSIYIYIDKMSRWKLSSY